METKKIIALAVLAIIALPSLTMVMGQDTVAIDGYKYEDKNGDGIHDEGEPGVEGVTITLTRTEADVDPSETETLTETDGYFSFNVEPGTYTVTETVPEGWVASTDTSYENIEVSGETVNLGFVFGNYLVETETDINCAIEIASDYLANIKGIVDALSEEYSGHSEHEPVLKQVNEILGYGDEDGAEDFLYQAMEAYNLGDYNLAARKLAAARNILGRVNGMLASVYKANQVERTARFMQQVEQRIVGLEDKMERLMGHLGDMKTNKAKVAMGLAKGRLGQLGASLSEDNVDDVIDELVITIASIDTTIDDLDGDSSTILKAMDRLEVKIRVLKASSEKLAKKGSDTSDIDMELNIAEDLLNNVVESLVEDDTDEAENLLEQAEDIVSESRNNIHTVRTQHKVQGNTDKKKGSH